jgi:hypothetical protein
MVEVRRREHHLGRPEPLPLSQGGGGDPAAAAVVRDGDVTVWKIDGALDPTNC